jgi:dihydrofolate reductase
MSRSLVYLVASTVDGFIAGADGATDMFSFEGPQVPGLLGEFPETIPGHLRGPLGIEGGSRRFDTVLMGRATYDAGGALGVTSPYPHLRQIVVSTSFDDTPHPAVELVSGDPVGRVRALKAESGGDVWLCGGGRLAATPADQITS